MHETSYCVMRRLCVFCAVDEGPIFAMCMTSQGDQATLNQWISGLQQNNPILGQVPTLLLLDAGSKRATDSESGHQHSTNPDNQREEREPEEEPEVLVIEKPGRSQRMKQWSSQTAFYTKKNITTYCTVNGWCRGVCPCCVGAEYEAAAKRQLAELSI